MRTKDILGNQSDLSIFAGNVHPNDDLPILPTPLPIAEISAFISSFESFNLGEAQIISILV